MIDPWTILGWLAIGALVTAAATTAARQTGSFLAWLYVGMHKHRMHRETRDTPPEEGQVWMQGDTKLHITRVTRAGRITVQCAITHGHTSWADTPEEWRDRVINQRLYLLDEVN